MPDDIRHRDRTTNSRILDDEQLRQAELCIERPEDQPGIVDTLPPGADFYDIENSYKIPDTEEKARCIKCGGRYHRLGLTARLTTGDLVLVGSYCAEDLFDPERVRPALRAHRDLLKRQRKLLRLDHLTRWIPYIIEGLYEWREVVREADRSRLNLGGRDQILAQRIEEACIADAGQLFRTERFWNTSGSSAYRQTKVDHTPESQKANNADDGIWDYRQVPDHRIAGAPFFEIRSAKQLLDWTINILHTLRNTNTVTSERIMLADRRLQEVIDDLDRIRRATNAANAFWRTENLEGIARWARHEGHGSGKTLFDSQPDAPIYAVDPAPLENLRATARGR